MVYDNPPSWRSWQRILNDVGARSYVRRDPIPVRARIVWADDGEEYLDGWAIAWTGDAVLVELRDPRCSTVGAWLSPIDVSRQ